MTKDDRPDNFGVAVLSSQGAFTSFAYRGDVIRFRTSKRLVRYSSVRTWDDGYLEVLADYGKGEVEEFIDLRPILDNLYYDVDAFLKPIRKVEVRYAEG